MRSAILLFLTVISAFTCVHSQSDDLVLAERCDPRTCRLPDCHCSDQEIPGNLAARDTPQFVLLTFDDAVTELNTQSYRSLLFGRFNRNRCPVGTTFFVSHEYTDYIMVNELYNQGFEIALHSISHRTPQTFWRDASHEELMREFGDQREQMAYFANIPINTLNGVRAPFLQVSGNNTFTMMRAAGITYDLSLPTNRFIDPAMWPYTLHYESTQDCVIGPCPTASIPGPWVIPMITWIDLSGHHCSMADACFHSPDSEEAWFRFIVRNFERHYLGNRAPFGIYIHEALFRTRPYAMRALRRFLDMINNLNDTFMVNARDVINWVRNPVPINEYMKQDCHRFQPSMCRPSLCSGLFSPDTQKRYYLRVCTRCPRNYPWVNNPLGR